MNRRAGPKRAAIGAMALALGLALGLAACGGGNGDADTTTSTVPSTRPVLTTEAFVPDTLPTGQSGTRTYTIAPGDTLFAIAEREDVSLQELYDLNGFDQATVLQPGDLIFLPPLDIPLDEDGNPLPSTTLPPGAQFYEIQAGDTLFGIADQFRITFDALVAANGYDPDDLPALFPGDRIVIPPP